jgi:hypothetical protein
MTGFLRADEQWSPPSLWRPGNAERIPGTHSYSYMHTPAHLECHDRVSVLYLVYFTWIGAARFCIFCHISQHLRFESQTQTHLLEQFQFLFNEPPSVPPFRSHLPKFSALWAPAAWAPAPEACPPPKAGGKHAYTHNGGATNVAATSYGVYPF